MSDVKDTRLSKSSSLEALIGKTDEEEEDCKVKGLTSGACPNSTQIAENSQTTVYVSQLKEIIKLRARQWPRARGFKHPLQNQWVQWYFNYVAGRPWPENQIPLMDIRYVEDFWFIQQQLKPPCMLDHCCGFSLFKFGVLPMWEDENNKNGGRWILTVKRDRLILLDKLWHELMLCLIGESFGEHGEEICGAFVSVRFKHRKPHKISLWTKDALKRDSIMAIGEKMKEKLSLGRFTTMNYYPNQKAMVHRNGSVIYLYSV